MLLSAAVHAVVFFAAFHAHWRYKIFAYSEKPREVFIAPRQALPFSVSPAAQSGRRVPGETEAAVPGQPPAKRGEVRSPAPAGGRNEQPRPSAGPAPAGGEAGPSGFLSAFRLNFPPESKLSLAKSADKIEDKLVPPGRYRARSDIDFSRYLTGSKTAGNGEAEYGEGPSGIGGGRPGQAGQRARRPSPGVSTAIAVPGVDFSAWAGLVINAIQRNWALDPSLGSSWKGEVGISVLVSKNGEVLAAEIDVPTKIEALDQAALRAVRASAPFPALPPRYPNASLEVYFVFKYGD